MRRPSHVLLNPIGTGGLCSSPPYWLVVIVVGVPSLLVTAAVCVFLYLSVRAFRRRQIARGAIMLTAALLPFIWFAGGIAQAVVADREHAQYVAGVAKTGPVTNYPNVLAVEGPFLEMDAAALMLIAGFREVDASQYGPKGSTFTLVATDDCRKRFEAWLAIGAGLNGYYPGVPHCISETQWDRNKPPERSSAVVLLRGSATLRRHGKGRGNLELHIKDGEKDVLVDYWEERYSTWPLRPLLVALGMMRHPEHDPRDREFVLRNLKR